MKQSDIISKEHFSNRHIGPSSADVNKMLKELNFNSVDEFIQNIIPKDINRKENMLLKPALSEAELLTKIKSYAMLNKKITSLIGMGYHNTFTPPVLLRNILENPAWYTAYTPYQPEISQGRLEALLNFQTMIADLTALPIANASLLDEATATAEAMTLCIRSTNEKTSILLDPLLHPQTVSVLKTRAEPLNLTLQTGNISDQKDFDQYACAIIQYPGTDGSIRNWEEEIAQIQSHGGMVIVVTDLLSLTLLKPPGEMGADIAVGSTQRFGVPMGYGGPHAAFFATKEKYSRKIPGRLIGVSQDSEGNKAYRLALQTREQHIRREKATSNICTAQALLAIMAGFYAVWHGASGLTNIASRVHYYTKVFAQSAKSSGYKIRHEKYFDTIVLETGKNTDKLTKKALLSGYNIRNLGQAISVSFDECSNEKTIYELSKALEISVNFENIPNAIPKTIQRTSKFLTHPVFSSYLSETEILRYIRSLSDKDLALDRTMIPLGSCTMKLNATTEMIPITWPEFSSIHPFAPINQTEGYEKLISELESWLCSVTGYDGVSLQPNAGSQGEFAGLMTIRDWHKSNGEEERNICLIPTSAHGTNPASAVMAGMEVILIDCDKKGNIDLKDLIKKASQYKNNLAAIMITYPSTHGVFEKDVKKVCEIVHSNGGQVYVDGANLNALIGLVSLSEIGADVSHLNLHKTFCIPHGGGGPGVGPVAVRKHLIPFLPDDPLNGKRAISATRYGSAGILPISWSYIAMMGEEGLKDATKIAILSANYIAKKLNPHFPILYTDDKGLVAHECILDISNITSNTNINNEDIAKRLIDYGFHAPTMSWPVPNTLMVEPTESEPLKELDRFCNAMIKIASEIKNVEKGIWPQEDNPLVNAPHTINVLTKEDWLHPYSRKIASAVSSDLNSKYWPSVGRINNAFGDRNLICSCPPLEDYNKEKIAV